MTIILGLHSFPSHGAKFHICGLQMCFSTTDRPKPGSFLSALPGRLGRSIALVSPSSLVGSANDCNGNSEGVKERKWKEKEREELLPAAAGSHRRRRAASFRGDRRASRPRATRRACP